LRLGRAWPLLLLALLAGVAARRRPRRDLAVAGAPELREQARTDPEPLPALVHPDVSPLPEAGRAPARRPAPGQLALLALLALCSGVWAVVAWRLWDSTLPGDLRPPDLDAADYFSAGQLRESARYERFLELDFLLSQAVLIGVLAVYAVRGHRFMRESAAGRIGTGMMLGMVGLGLVWLVQLPFSLAAFWWQRRNDIVDDGYGVWLAGSLGGLAGTFLFVSFALLIVMALAGPLKQRWWIVGGPAFVALALLFTFVDPYLRGDLRSLENPALAAEARELARAQGVDEIPVEVEPVQEFTSAPNAEATGLGPSRRVILWDTLLDGRFSDDEVEVVLAHEFGHHAHGHIPESIAWYALFAIPGAFLLAFATARVGGMRDPRAVPLSLLVLTVLQLAALPAQNVVSRRLESEADWAALRATRDPSAAKGLFRGFTRETLQQPDPPTWSYVLLGSHPSVIQRIAMAEEWERRRGR